MTNIFMFVASRLVGWIALFIVVYWQQWLGQQQLMSELSEQVQHQRARAERAQAELEAYKKQSKEMEEYLEGESAKKEAEIRKMINDAIMKEKAYKAQKTELTELQNENAKLKEEIAQLQQQSKGFDPAVLTKMEEEASSLRKAVEQLKQQLSTQRQKITNLNEGNKNKEAQWAKKEAQLNEEIESAKNLAQQLKKANEVLTEKLNSKNKIELDKKVAKQAELQRQSSKKQIKLGKQLDRQKEKLQQRMKHLEQTKRKLQQMLTKSDKTIKDLRLKNQTLIDENQSLQSRISAMATMSNCNSQSVISPFGLKSVIEEEDSSWGRINYSCLLLTKPHYVSPFLQVEQEKQMVKIYKSSRSGCFEKSMGLYKHRFDVLSYDQEQVIDPIINSITQSEHASHSVILFGVKKSSKKYLMAKLVQKLKAFLLGKLEQGEEASAEFTVRSQDEEKNETVRGNESSSIGEVLERVIGKGKKSEKQKGKQWQKKGQSKPKVRYFSFKTNNFSLEIGTSSFTSLSFRDKMTSTNMLNNILYSKLPDILQSAISLKYLILTLNPIVDLYEDCRNTLSTTLCRAVAVQSKEEEQDRGWRASPVREQLNEVAKKKLEIFERESEQASLKMRKLEQECAYFKSRFDELQFRLKNLLNTHAGQNSYLKKSPVTLSYQKLLKFVHSVQSRASATLNSTLLGNSMLKSAVNDREFREYDSPEAL